MAVQRGRQRVARLLRGWVAAFAVRSVQPPWLLFHAAAQVQLKLAESGSSEKPKCVLAACGGCFSTFVKQNCGSVVGCGRPAPGGGFPFHFWLMCNCYRLQEEMLQREEAEGTLQSFRQVCKSSPTRNHWTTPTLPCGEGGGRDWLKEVEGISQRIQMKDPWTRLRRRPG